MDKSIDRLDIFDVDLLLSYFFFLTLLLRPCVAAAAEEERGQEWKWENGQLCAWSCALIGPRSAIYPFCLPPSTSSSWPGGRLGERERSNGLVWLATRTQHALTDAAPPTDATPHPNPFFLPSRKACFFLSFFLSVSPAAALALSSLHFLLESTLHVIPIPPLSEESGRVWRLLFLYFGTNSIFHPPPDLKLGRRRRRHHGIERVLLPYEFVHYYKTGDPLLSLSLNRI